MKRFICFSIAPGVWFYGNFGYTCLKNKTAFDREFPNQNAFCFQTALRPNQLLITSTLVSKVTVCWYLDAVLRFG